MEFKVHIPYKDWAFHFLHLQQSCYHEQKQNRYFHQEVDIGNSRFQVKEFGWEFA